MTRQQAAPDLYQSSAHTCPYLSRETAANLLIDPKFNVTPAMYDSLIRNGFRRNGALYYRPLNDINLRLLNIDPSIHHKARAGKSPGKSSVGLSAKNARQ